MITSQEVLWILTCAEAGPMRNLAREASRFPSLFRRWILVSHPHTLSPFGEASFLNYTSKLRFRKVTDSNETFGEWKGMSFLFYPTIFL